MVQKVRKLRLICIEIIQTKVDFTLVELLIVISIISILVSILLPALGKARLQAKRAVCASNMRQWGIALHEYAGDNETFFPDNTQSPSPDTSSSSFLCYTSSTVLEFWEKYLMKAEKGDLRTALLFCPTQNRRMLRDRDYESGANNFLDFNDFGYCGYFYLPYRDADAGVLKPNYSPSTNPNGRGWVEKKKLGGRYRKAPLAMDIMEYFQKSRWSTSNNKGSASVGKYSSHALGKGGKPTGGNFLFEDSHVDWYTLDEISIGAEFPEYDWDYFYKPYHVY